MQYPGGRALLGAALVLALSGAVVVRAQATGEAFDPAQVRRAALAAPESGIRQVSDAKTQTGHAVLRLTATGGFDVIVQGADCTANRCKLGRFWTMITPPAGVDRQQLADRYNASPRWASAHVKGDGIELRGEILYAGGITDANLAQYLRSITYHAARLAAGQA